MDEIEKYILKHYYQKTWKEISEVFGCTKPMVGNRVTKLRSKGYLKKPKENTGCFKANHTPFNKGMKGLNTSGSKGWFKKGNIPHNAYEDGTVTTRHHVKDEKEYKYIHFKGKRAQLYHRWLWEQKHGKLKKNEVLRFIDGDSLNCELDNLMKVSRVKHLAMNRNEEKRIQTIKRMAETGENLTDKKVAAALAQNNHELKEHIMANHPELIELKREQLKLRQQIKKHKSKSK